AFDWSIANSRLRAKSQVPISLSFCANSIGRHEVNLTIRGTQISNDCLSERHFDLVNLHVSAAIESPAIIMEPNLVQLERSIVLTETLRLEIKLTNPSAVCPIAFCWELSRMKKAFLNSVVSNEQAEIVRGSVDLESGLLQPLETQIIKLSLTPLRVGSIECLLPCRLNDQPDGLTWLQVLFVVVSPNIELETDSIDFGKLRPGQCATRTTYLANPASLSLSWAVKHPQMANAIFSIEPSKGIIKAKCNAKISLAFRPRNVGQFDVEIPFSVDGAPLRTLRLTGEAVQPVVIVEPQELQINEAFLNVPQTIEVNLKNTSAVSSTFRWLQVEDVSEGSVEVSVSPSCGHIGPNKCTIIRVMCTGKALGIFKDVRLYCEVDGLSEPLLLNLSVKVGGLSCRITAPSDGFSPNLD
uniref:ASH domain-containing protein n=1 Tax=Mesocestoides corti TaxID=53468 RepID=A0A5K3F7K7_MESCO